jgi:hypothetical protein
MLSRETQQDLNLCITKYPKLYDWIIRIQSNLIFDEDGKEFLDHHLTLEAVLWCVWAVREEEFEVFKYITGLLRVVSHAVRSEVLKMESSSEKKDKFLDVIRDKFHHDVNR